MTEEVERVLSKLAERVKEAQWTLDGSMFEVEKKYIRTVENSQCPLEFLTGRSCDEYSTSQIAHELSVSMETVEKIANAADSVFGLEGTDEEIQEIRQKLLEMTGLERV